MDASNTSGKSRSRGTKVDGASLASHVESLESRLSLLEKRDKDKNKEIMELKDETLSLHNSIQTLTRTKSDKDMEETRWKKYKHKTTETLRKGLERIETMQKVFNRMIVNGHKTDMDEKIQDMSSIVDRLRGEVMKYEANDLESKIHDLSSAIDGLCKEAIRHEEMDLETKIKDLSSTTDGLHREMMEFKQMGLAKQITDLSRTTDGLNCEHKDVEQKIKDLSSTLDGLRRDMMKYERMDLESKIPELETCFEILENDILKLQRPSVEEKIVSYLRDKLMEGTDMQIIVKFGKKKFTLDVEPTLTIRALKSVLENKTTIPVSDQVLHFGKTKLANNSQALKDYDIKHESMVSLMKKTDSVNIIVKQPTGQERFWNVRLSHTIRELKTQIEKETNVYTSKQVLHFGQTNLTDETKTLRDYGFTDDSLVDLTEIKRSKWQIVVDNLFNGQQVTLDVGVKTSVEDVLSEVHHKIQVPMDESLALLFKDQRLDHSKLLVEYEIRHDSVLKLMTKSKSPPILNHEEMTIFINTKENYADCSGKHLVPLKVYMFTSIFHVKNLLHLKTKRVPSVQTLTFNQQDLNNDKTLSAYNINNLSTIDVSYNRKQDSIKTIDIQVSTHSDKKPNVRKTMALSNTVWDLKCIIEDKLGLDVGSQKLILNGLMFSPMGAYFYELDLSDAVKMNPGVMLMDNDRFENILSHDRVMAFQKTVYGLYILLVTPETNHN